MSTLGKKAAHQGRQTAQSRKGASPTEAEQKQAILEVTRLFQEQVEDRRQFESGATLTSRE